jgi:hypothetical protein
MVRYIHKVVEFSPVAEWCDIPTVLRVELTCLCGSRELFASGYPRGSLERSEHLLDLEYLQRMSLPHSKSSVAITTVRIFKHIFDIFSEWHQS